MTKTTSTKVCALCEQPLVGGRRYCSKTCANRARVRIKAPLSVRLWRRVTLGDGDACYVWQGATESFGYGVIGDENGRQGGNLLTHRASWMLTYGPIPEGMCVLHACDNPPCVRPDHLFLGTRLDNNLDMVNKGRHAAQIGTHNLPRGEEHRRSKVTGAQVLDMRARYQSKQASVQQLADEYELDVSTVHRMATGRAWKHLEQTA